MKFFLLFNHQMISLPSASSLRFLNQFMLMIIIVMILLSLSIDFIKTTMTYSQKKYDRGSFCERIMLMMKESRQGHHDNTNQTFNTATQLNHMFTLGGCIYFYYMSNNQYRFCPKNQSKKLSSLSSTLSASIDTNPLEPERIDVPLFNGKWCRI